MLPGTKVFALIGVVLLLFTLSFIYSPAHSSTYQGTIKESNTKITLFDTPCISKKVAAAHPQKDMSEGLAASVMYKGKIYEACWVFLPQHGVVYVIDEDGGEGPVNPQHFKEVPQI